MSYYDSLYSRAEIYLNALINSTGTEGLPKPLSRGEEYLLALIAKTKTTDLTIGRLDSTLAALSGISVISPETHRNVFRGKNLGSSVTTEQKEAISSGTFDDLFVGDYWTIGGIDYIIADMDYWYLTGDIPFSKHHLVMTTKTLMYNHVMNDTDTTVGGYVGSKMYTTGLNQAKTTIQTAFGELLLTHREYLTNAVSSGYPSGAAWFDSNIELMNEIMVYGSYIYTPAATGSTKPEIHTIDKQQLALFNLDPKMINNREIIWLRDVVSSVDFARVYYYGLAHFKNATRSYGVRPVFAIG